MANTLAFGFLDPESGDQASVWQAAVNSTVQQLATHNHDGVNSASISPASIAILSTGVNATVGALPGEWTETPGGSGTYIQRVPAPGAVSEVNDFFPKVYENSTGNVLSLSINRFDATNIELSSNNPVAMTVVWK